MPLAARMATSDLWWMDAVIYCLDVETFADDNGDGVGDFAGLTSHLDYLSALGVTCIWLLPFHPSPNRDDGYDVTDYFNIDPRFGTLGDFVTFRRAAAEHGMRVMIDLVLNHTSDQHPWFTESRSDRDSPKRDWYVWADEPVKEAEAIVFPGEQDGNWAPDEQSGQYYFHRFHSFQPSLNMAHAPVREELYRILGFWMELGVSGFRVDAAPFLIETVGPNGPVGERNHDILRELRAFVSRRRGDAVLVGEANLPPEETPEYFGSGAGDELHLLYNFDFSAHLALALARGDSRPLRKVLDRLPACPDLSGWVNFIRLHDEWSVERLDQSEREEVASVFAPDEPLLYGRGLRRRAAPLLDDDARVELAFALMLSFPGILSLLYGEEIGMGDRPDLPSRHPGPHGVVRRTEWRVLDNKRGDRAAGRRRRTVRPIDRQRARAAG